LQQQLHNDSSVLCEASQKFSHQLIVKEDGHIDDCDNITLGNSATLLVHSAEHDVSHDYLEHQRQASWSIKGCVSP